MARLASSGVALTRDAAQAGPDPRRRPGIGPRAHKSGGRRSDARLPTGEGIRFELEHSEGIAVTVEVAYALGPSTGDSVAYDFPLIFEVNCLVWRSAKCRSRAPV